VSLNASTQSIITHIGFQSIFRTYIEYKTNNKQRGWQVDLVNQTVLFAQKHEEKVAIPKQKMIVAALEYAKELEQIM
jgi:26S proteasome regulatory subunit N12